MGQVVWKKCCQVNEQTYGERNNEVYQEPKKLSNSGFVTPRNQIRKNINHFQDSSQNDNQKIKKAIQSIESKDTFNTNNINSIYLNKKIDEKYGYSGSLGIVSKQSNTKDYLTQQIASVPSKTVIQFMSEFIYKQITQLQQDFHQNCDDISHHLNFAWRQHNQNLFTNNVPNGTIYILTKDLLYKGWTNINSLVPENSGILISWKGIYKGTFLDGKADGHGQFTSYDKSAKYRGKWKHGSLVKGSFFKNQLRVYQGSFMNGVPHGDGKMVKYNKEESSKRKRNVYQFQYQGQFKQGKFNGKGKYSCKRYIYKGNFQNNKRNGNGKILILPSQKYQRMQFQGFWQNDQLKNKKIQ